MTKKLLSIVAITGLLLAQRGNISIDQIRQTDRKGTGSRLQVFGGGTTSAGQNAVYDANGNVIAGAGGGGGASLVQSPLVFPRQAPIVPLGLAITTAVTVANTVSTTSLIGPTYWGSAVLPGGYWIGRTVRLRATGLYGTAVALPALTIVVKLGGVTLATISPTILSNVSSDGWALDYSFTVTSLVAVNGAGCFTDLGTSGAIIGGCAGGATSGLNFAVAQTIALTAAWGTADPSNTITAYVATISPLS